MSGRDTRVLKRSVIAKYERLLDLLRWVALLLHLHERLDSGVGHVNRASSYCERGAGGAITTCCCC